MAVPIVFISYSHDSDEHRRWVLDLATELRRNGVDAYLDQWDLRPGQSMTTFMEKQIRDADFVILVCTSSYAHKSNMPQGGVGYEKNIISAEMLMSGGLDPKFIPILREGDHSTSLPTYLGSKYAIDFRSTADHRASMEDLLRSIFNMPPEKPPLGPSPFNGDDGLGTEDPSSSSSSSEDDAATGAKSSSSSSESDGDIVDVSGHVESWAARALGRFDFLRETHLTPEANPFEKGFWQASFALNGTIHYLSLNDLLKALRASETGRTGWDVGWVPTRKGIAPYPFQDGIECWMAEDGHEEPSQSDFWRAEQSGTFAIFRGYQEDSERYSAQHPGVQLDYSLVLWRITEVFYYLESFARNVLSEPGSANMLITWNGLNGRILGTHKPFSVAHSSRTSRQDSVTSQIDIPNTHTMRETLVRDVVKATKPLFEIFNFFEVSEDQAATILTDLMNAIPDRTES